jgi:hypothetical protein
MRFSGQSGGAIATTPPLTAEHTTWVGAVALRMSTEACSVAVRMGASTVQVHNSPPDRIANEIEGRV